MAPVPPRLFVVPSPGSPHAVILRRGPSGQVASLGWNRDTDEIAMGQWLKGRIFEHRADLSPDGRHFIYFAGTGDPAHATGGWWTAIARAPWLTAIWMRAEGDTWGGGGAFTAPGRVWLNGGGQVAARAELTPEPDPNAFPHSTDGFHMGDLYAARMARQGWEVRGTGYDVVLRKPLGGGRVLLWRVETGQENRALVAGIYAIEGPAGVTPCLNWDWADLWAGGLRYAVGGCLWALPGTDPGAAPRRIHDFNPMRFEPIRAPYEGCEAAP